jgi:hypothetical protein
LILGSKAIGVIKRGVDFDATAEIVHQRTGVAGEVVKEIDLNTRAVHAGEPLLQPDVVNTVRKGAVQYLVSNGNAIP